MVQVGFEKGRGACLGFSFVLFIEEGRETPNRSLSLFFFFLIIYIMIILFKYCADVENCGSFRDFGFIYIYIYIYDNDEF